MSGTTPYDGRRGTWIRANLHTHCSEHSPCARIPLATAARMYEALGARVVAFTDHDHVTDLGALDARHPGVVFLRGFEYTHDDNLLFVGPAVPPLHEIPLAEAAARAGDLLTIVCHPAPRTGSAYWTADKIRALGRMPDGIEVYNGHYGTPRMRAMGYTPIYTRMWDDLLTRGMRLWGFANDDFHDSDDFDNAFTMVLADDPSPSGIIRALKSGACYASTGLLAERVSAAGGVIDIRFDAPATGRLIGAGGRVLSERVDTRFECRADGGPYVRFEAERDGAMLWLQPVFGF